MSMLALCLSMVSRFRVGSARELITLSVEFPFGYCNIVTFVILPPVRVSWTWTGPHWVDATDPVTVDDFDDPEVEVPPGVLPETADGGVPAARVDVVEVW